MSNPSDPIVRRPSLLIFTVLAVIIGTTRPAIAAQPLIELTTKTGVVQGKNIFHDKSICHLIAPDGQLHEVRLSEVTSFQSLSPQFQPFTSLDLKRHLQEEFGRSTQVALKGSFVVAATGQLPAGTSLPALAQHCDETSRSFRHYFSIRGFDLLDSEFPLSILIFPGVTEFARYCQKDGVPFAPGLMGYYQPRTHRVALYLNENIDHADFLDTLTHELTHQLAFDAGLHSRFGENPKWIVEGLAMVFESSIKRNDSLRGNALARANPDRLVWFGSYAQSRRTPGQLVNTIRLDTQFSTATLDAYSEAWALTFYLMETRRDDFISFLKQVSHSSRATTYSANDRITDFEASFGNDLSKLERDYVRFITDLP